MTADRGTGYLCWILSVLLIILGLTKRSMLALVSSVLMMFIAREIFRKQKREFKKCRSHDREKN